MAQKLHSIQVNGALYELPTVLEASDNLRQLNESMSSLGVSAESLVESVRTLADLYAQLQWSMHKIDEVQKDLTDLKYHCEGRDGDLSARTDLVEYKLNELRSALDAKIENPNQKDDLEISNRIVPCEDFLKLTGNMFLN